MKQRQLNFDCWAEGIVPDNSGLDVKRVRKYCTSELTGPSGPDSTGMLWQRLKWQEDNVCPLRQGSQI